MIQLEKRMNASRQKLHHAKCHKANDCQHLTKLQKVTITTSRMQKAPDKLITFFIYKLLLVHLNSRIISHQYLVAAQLDSKWYGYTGIHQDLQAVCIWLAKQMHEPAEFNVPPRL